MTAQQFNNAPSKHTLSPASVFAVGTQVAYIRLRHGTDVASANDIMTNGVSQTAAALLNVSGEFWAATDERTANMFAQVNPSNGPPARVDFDLPDGVLAMLVRQLPPLVNQNGPDTYEFLPASFPDLNHHMANVQVVPLP